MTTSPTVSVVIPTYNRLARLKSVLSALDVQTYPADKFEVVVVSDGSTDGTDEFLAGSKGPFELAVVTQPNQGPAVARNRGVEAARGSIVLFIDDDVVATPRLIEEHVQSHAAAAGDVVVIGPMSTPPGFAMRPWVAWEQDMLHKQYAAMNAGVFAASFRQFYTGNASLPRDRFLEVGGFDARFRRAEDVELAYRLDGAGLRWIWNSHAVGLHYADRPFDSWLRTARDYGTNEVIFGRDEGQDPALRRVRIEFTRRHLVIRALAVAAVSAPWVERGVTAPLRGLAVAAHRLGLSRIATYALSALFNTEYFCAMAQELGGAEEFRRVVVGSGEARRRRAVGR